MFNLDNPPVDPYWENSKLSSFEFQKRMLEFVDWKEAHPESCKKEIPFEYKGCNKMASDLNLDKDSIIDLQQAIEKKIVGEGKNTEIYFGDLETLVSGFDKS